MKKVIACLLVWVVMCVPVLAEEGDPVKPVKNIILLIPDGTSLPTVSMARWLQWYNHPDLPELQIDPYLCGTVRTHSSNEPVPDSAPTTSCYMTGYPSSSGFVSTYPEKDPDNDFYPVDSLRTYQPLTTLLEAAKIKYGKSTGLVFTCKFPHATPADCSAHSYNRNKYEWIAQQMIHNDLNVVIGSGISYLSEEGENYLKSNGYGIYKNDLLGMRNDKGNNMWALFGENDMDYDLDRDPQKQPSLEETTRIAIQKLSQNPNGFFLMVEGSKVDQASHANDPIAMATEFLAFDKACGVALDFAKKNGETAVVVVPDHGNSGISIGRTDRKHLTKKHDMLRPFSLFKSTSEGLVKKMNSRPNSELQSIFKEYAGFELTPNELKLLNNHKEYKNSPIPESQRSLEGVEASLYSNSLTSLVSQLLTSRTCFGFTTSGHTGEDVFLAVYHPQGTLPIGMNSNVKLNQYLCALFGLDRNRLDELTNQIFVPHTEVFKNYTYEIVFHDNQSKLPELVVKNKKRNFV